jgi:hypothetical protein
VVPMVRDLRRGFVGDAQRGPDRPGHHAVHTNSDIDKVLSDGLCQGTYPAVGTAPQPASYRNNQ